MMHEEFERLAGYEVDGRTYREVIEPMYMALPEGISKQQFVAMLDSKAFALPTRSDMIREMRKMARCIFEGCGLTAQHGVKAELHRLADAFAKRFYGPDSYTWFDEAVGYAGARITNTTRGCRFLDALHIASQDGTEYEKIQLVPRIVYRVHTGARGRVFDSLVDASIYANDHQRRTGDFVAVTEEVERLRA